MGNLASLSDPHNFGQRVELINPNLIFKPRCVFWESMLLGRGAFRSRLLEMEHEGLHSAPVRFPLPELEFTSVSAYSGTVSFLGVTKPAFLEVSDAVSVGNALGLFLWLGLTDLHKENIFWGFKDSSFVFTPVDIETVFDDARTLGHTALVPDSQMTVERSGISELLDLARDGRLELGHVAAICAGFLSASNILQENRKSLERIICNEIKNNDIPIRVVFRKTLSYLRFLKMRTSLEILRCLFRRLN